MGLWSSYGVDGRPFLDKMLNGTPANFSGSYITNRSAGLNKNRVTRRIKIIKKKKKTSIILAVLRILRSWRFDVIDHKHYTNFHRSGVYTGWATKMNDFKITVVNGTEIWRGRSVEVCVSVKVMVVWQEILSWRVFSPSWNVYNFN